MPEIVAASVIACLPCFAFLLARFYTNNLQLRYVIPTVSGLAVLVCAVAQSLGGARAWVGRLLVCFLCALLAYECLPQVWQYARSNAARSRDFTVIEEGSRRALQAGALLTTTSPGVLVETQFYHPEIPVVYLCGFRSQDNYDEITRHARVWFNVLERQELAQHDCYVIVPKITGHEVLDWFIAHAHDGWQVVSGAPLESGENVYLAKRNKIAIGVAN